MSKRVGLLMLSSWLKSVPQQTNVLADLGMDVNELLSFATRISCDVASFHMTNPALLLRANPKSKTIWDNVVTKLEKQLSNWVRQHLL